MFSSLKALWLCDTNFPGMDKIYYLVYCARAAVAKSEDILNDEKLFGPIAQHNIDVMASEEDEVFGCDDKGISMIEL